MNLYNLVLLVCLIINSFMFGFLCGTSICNPTPKLPIYILSILYLLTIITISSRLMGVLH